jgi:hypothetical protein
MADDQSPLELAEVVPRASFLEDVRQYMQGAKETWSTPLWHGWGQAQAAQALAMPAGCRDSIKQSSIRH